MKNRVNTGGGAWIWILVALALAAIAAAYLYERAERHAEKHREQVVPVLMYHRIGDGDQSPWWVPKSVFAEQMQFLEEVGYTTVLPSDLVAKARRGRKLPAKPIVITFDDGHLNCMTEAEPILKQHGFCAVNFLITDFIAEKTDERRSYEDAPCLVWPEVLAMQERGTIHFGGHSRTHANLRALGQPEPEIQGCYDQLVQHGVRAPQGFCFPHGQYGDHTLAALRASSFKIGFVVEDQLARIGGTNNLRVVPRISVFGGARSYRVSDFAIAASNAVQLTLRFEGRDRGVPGSPRLTGPGLSGESCWLEARRVMPGASTLAWTLNGSSPAGGTYTFEVWDEHRVLRLYRETLELPPADR